MISLSNLLKDLGRFWLTVVVFLCIHSAVFASSSMDAVRRLVPGKIRSAEEMKSAVFLLRQAAVADNSGDFDPQKLILDKSGECISRMATQFNVHHEQGRTLFVTNRETIQRILKANEAVIADFQEKRLDRMDHPVEFFNSPEWQNPQHLISLASYWLGWNGYYGALLFPPDDPMKQTFLTEAVNGFSRAAADFREDAVIARSLFGRGLGYRELKSFKPALQDFESVKKKVGREDPLYVKSCLERIRTRYIMGDYKATLADLDAFRNEFSGEDLPGDIRQALDALKARATMALFEKKPSDKPSEEKVPDKKQDQRLFEEMKRMAVDPGGAAEFYRFVQSHAEGLDRLPLVNLGPVAAVALGDLFFDRKNLDRALYYYLSCKDDFPSVLQDRMDGVWFRIAYIYCNQKNWDPAFTYLENFHRKFPKSRLGDPSAALYYASTLSAYREDASEKRYNRFIDSVRIYLKHCRGGCPERSGARFQLGMHYLKTGQEDLAAAEFIHVGEDSPNYFLARYHVLKQLAAKLETIQKAGEKGSEAEKEIYREGLVILKKSKGRSKGAPSSAAKKIEPNMVLLEARLLTYGPDDDCKKSLGIIRDFEKRFPDQKNLFARALSTRMTCFLRLGMAREAGSELTRFITAFPVTSGRYPTLLNLANAFYREADNPRPDDRSTAAGQYREMALMVYEAIAPFSCHSPEYEKYCGSTQIRMARIHEKENRLKEAETLYREVLDHTPSSADAVYGLGLVYEKMEKWDRALSTWRTFSDGIAQGTPHWYESRLKIALALAKLGQTDKACDVVSSTLVLHPDLGSDELEKKFRELKSKLCVSRQIK